MRRRKRRRRREGGGGYDSNVISRLGKNLIIYYPVLKM